MNEEPPKDLAGWQHLAPDEPVEVGDLVVWRGVPKYLVTCWESNGQVRVKEYESDGFSVYRRLPVAKQIYDSPKHT